MTTGPMLPVSSVPVRSSQRITTGRSLIFDQTTGAGRPGSDGSGAASMLPSNAKMCDNGKSVNRCACPSVAT